MIVEMLLGAAAVTGGMHAAARLNESRRRSYRPVRRESRLVKLWNAAGAPYTAETELGDALADLGGRALGHMVRRGTRAVRGGGGRLGRRAARIADQRWQRRQREGGTTTFFRRRRADRDGGPQMLPPGPPPGSPSGTPDRPAPASPAGPPPPQAQPSPSPSPGSGARRARRAHARMRISGTPIRLDVPESDAEFLEICTELQHILRGVAAAVEQWTGDVAARRLPPIVTGPLEEVADDLVAASAGARRAAVVFEVLFEDAREIASAGIKFTGDDPA